MRGCHRRWRRGFAKEADRLAKVLCSNVQCKRLDAAPAIRNSNLLLVEEVANWAAFVLVLDPSKKLCTKFPDCFRVIEGQTRVHGSATEVTRLAILFKDWLDIGGEVNLRRGVDRCWGM
jgi:hypothetical protein